jgi:hypothetical protein
MQPKLDVYELFQPLMQTWFSTANMNSDSNVDKALHIDQVPSASSSSSSSSSYTTD